MFLYSDTQKNIPIEIGRDSDIKIPYAQAI